MKKNLPKNSVLQRAYDNPDKSTHYDDWANTYDADLDKEGFVAPEHAAALLKSVAPDADRVVDFGCGTGLAGAALAALGYQNLYGLDISEGMIEKAQQRGCYRSVRQHDLRTPMLDDIRYQAGICVGVCAFGPVNAGHIAHMTQVLDSGAPLILTINGLAWQEQDWAQQLDEAQEEHGYTVEYIKTIPYLVAKEIEAKLLIIRNAELESAQTCQPIEKYSDT